jgi:cyclopropane fatty-acyl-phospholipid synthase-like methyltransferase
MSSEIERSKPISTSAKRRTAVNEYVVAVLKQCVGIDGKCLVDIGCGSGELVAAAALCGAKVLGIDIDAERVRSAQNKLNIIAGTIESISRRFDVITYVDVLEHIVEIRAQLTEARGRLADDGVVVILTPCTDGLLYKLAKKLFELKFRSLFLAFWNIGYSYPHRHLFSGRSLAKLASECGYEVRRSVYQTGFYRLDRMLTLAALVERGPRVKTPTRRAAWER